MKTFVIVPVFNEQDRIVVVINQILKYCKNIIVVNDGSKDNTKQVLKKLPVVVLNFYPNRGKGNVLRKGCDYALEEGAEQIVVIDGDGQHEPKDIPRLLKELENNDIVFTYRHFKGSMPFIFRFGNWFISKTANILFNIKLWDTQCGYRAFKTKHYNKIRWSADRYFMDTEMIINVGSNKLKYSQINIKTIYSDKRKGTNIFDGIKIVWNMLKWKMKM